MKKCLSKSITILSCMMFTLFISSCSSKDRVLNDTDSLVYESDLLEDPDNGLSIAIDISNENNEASLQYSVTENGDTIKIMPSSGYFKEYCKDEEMEFQVEKDVYCSDYVENPRMECYITNNGTETITFDKLRINVENSDLDTFPLVYIEQMEFLRYSMEILNECWTDWGTMTIEYSFDKKGKTFKGKYDHVLKVPYFKDSAIIDFRTDLISEGFDPEKVENFIVTDYPEEMRGADVPIFGHKSKRSDILCVCLDNELNPSQLAELAYPFEYGYGFADWPYIFARIHARLSFSKSKFTKKITGIIPLTCVSPGGAENDLDDKFDITLKPEGKDYYMDLPYKTTLAPGESERIQIRIKCDKSSHHRMALQLISNDEVVKKSKPIYFYNVNGRHSSYHQLKDY